jgi:hypothetical protein
VLVEVVTIIGGGEHLGLVDVVDVECLKDASLSCPMRAFAITGMETAAWIPLIMSGSLMRATPPSRRMSEGTRSRAMTATAPASSAIFASAGLTTSMITPPLSIWARPLFVAQVDVLARFGAGMALFSHTVPTPQG